MKPRSACGWSGTLLLLSIAGCASNPPQELLDARSTYAHARQDQASAYAGSDMKAAREILALAEKSYDDNGDTFETKSIAYAARRRVELASAKARGVMAAAREESAKEELQSVKDQALRNNQNALERERMAREASDKRAAELATLLAQAGAVKEPRGMVITLPGTVLFASNKSELLSSSTEKLNQAATALVQQDKTATIRVEGHTDSTGASSTNQALSQARAEAVRSYLVSHGVDASRITAIGMGSNNPVASNATPEGRANNRRVEIIVHSSQQ